MRISDWSADVCSSDLDEEIRRTSQILARRTKTNPVLIAEPGVGKTAIAEGLALRIANRDVPDTLKDRTLMTLDSGSLLAGPKYLGEFEGRPPGVLAGVKPIARALCHFLDVLLAQTEIASTGGR